MFTWQRDGLFGRLVTAFADARALPAEAAQARFARLAARLDAAGAQLDGLAATDALPVLARMEALQFHLAALAAAHASLLEPATAALHRQRLAVLAAARNWPPDDVAVRDAVYRIIYGGRNAIEEALAQNRDADYAALARFAGEDAPRSLPSVTIEGVTLYSGDVILSRGGAPTSALIARGNVYPGNFSHVAMLYVDADSGEAVILESLIEAGAVLTSVEDYFAYRSRRLLVLRLRATHPALAADPQLPHRAARAMRANIAAHRIGYDFALDWRDASRMFCAEVPYHAYREQGVRLWRWRARLDAPGLKRWLGDLGVRHFETLIPSDIEYDPALVPVVEWRDLDALRRDRLDNAILDVLLEDAARGVRLDYPWYRYPLYAVVKAWSWLVARFGGRPPIPEGMRIDAALRVTALVDEVHPRLYRGLEKAADDYRAAHGFAPPYWELLALARAVRDTHRHGLPLTAGE